jgi:hypothetical protein
VWIGIAVVVGLVVALSVVGNRRRGGNRGLRLGRARAGGQAERNATGSSVTGNIQNHGSPGGF